RPGGIFHLRGGLRSFRSFGGFGGFGGFGDFRNFVRLGGSSKHGGLGKHGGRDAFGRRGSFGRLCERDTFGRLAGSGDSSRRGGLDRRGRLRSFRGSRLGGRDTFSGSGRPAGPGGLRGFGQRGRRGRLRSFLALARVRLPGLRSGRCSGRTSSLRPGRRFLLPRALKTSRALPRRTPLR
ncbi:hypothetical protein JHN47_52110, partial [Streptomyces sp. MBT62]|nr:hypothetical protein [Streptomyces sp. MBT62]